MLLCQKWKNTASKLVQNNNYVFQYQKVGFLGDQPLFLDLNSFNPFLAEGNK